METKSPLLGYAKNRTDELFSKIKSESYDKSVERKIRNQNAEHNRQKQAAEKKIKAAHY